MRISAIIVLILLALLVSCSDDDDYAYPSVVTDMTLVYIGSDSHAVTITTDDGHTYSIVNTVTAKNISDRSIRVLATYLPIDSENVKLYNTVATTHLYGDSAKKVCHDKVEPISVWRKGHFINMHFFTRTQQKGTQYWGYSIDSTKIRHKYISLHHNQNNDPESYSTHIYAYINFYEMPLRESLQAGDTISFTIAGYKGNKTWQFIN